MLQVINGDITKLNVDAIVNASNGIGVLGAGVAGAIRRAGGPEIEKESKIYCDIYAPQAGHVFMTRAGDLPCHRVFHAVTMKFPGTSYRQNQEKGKLVVRNCVNRVFKMFRESELQSLAIPGMATGIGGLDPSEVAEIVIRGAMYYKFNSPESDKDLIICDIDYEFTDWCEIWLDKLEREQNEKEV